ncbi:CbtA family protein [Nocardia harenae]|uniref:CbtA family protein n=1 Tax=Nocardia harenae TaxID=358707 RepID=UPI0008329984|nr:CbtA family protein [Nocardia harenae]
MPLTESLKTLLLRGLLAGVLAGLLAATVGYFVGEPKVDAAIAIEEAAAESHPHTDEPAGHSHDEEEALVSRDGQKAGQFLALGLAGAAFGVLVGAAVHLLRRFGTGPLFGLAVALAGWLAVVLVPFFKYPANPPAVGDPETINDRTWLWVAAVLLGLVAVAAAVFGYRLLAGQLRSVRLIGGVAAFVAVVILGYVLLPGVNEVSADFPAGLLWEFRVSSLAVSSTLWVALGLLFAALSEFAAAPRTPVRDEVATAA